MIQTAVQQVECVTGCGGSGPGVLGLIGIAVAVISAVLAAVAAVLSRRSANSAAASLEIARDQHAEWMKSLSQKPDLTAAVVLFDPRTPTGLIETSEDSVDLAWLTIVANEGPKTATRVATSLTVPADLSGFAWARPGGKQVADGPPPPVRGLGPEPTKSQALHLDIEAVGYRTPAASWARATVSVPPEVGSERVVEAEFHVWFDGLEEEDYGPVATYSTIIKRVADP